MSNILAKTKVERGEIRALAEGVGKM